MNKKHYVLSHFPINGLITVRNTVKVGDRASHYKNYMFNIDQTTGRFARVQIDYGNTDILYRESA